MQCDAAVNDIRRGCVIHNPQSGSAAELAPLLPRLQSRGFELCPTDHPGHARELAVLAARRNRTLVIAAGGDGTVSEVASGLIDVPGTTSTLAILPQGTGNDLARTLAIPLDTELAIDAIADARTATLDAIELTIAGQRRLCINVTAGGFSGQVSEATTAERKQTWGPLAYLRSALGELTELTRYRAWIRIDGGPEREVQLLNAILANARTAGGGTAVAPSADPTDGRFDVVLVHGGGTLDIAGVAARLVAGNYTDSEIVEHVVASSFALRSDPPMPFNVDGELVGETDLSARVLPAALRVVVGPDFSPVPADATADDV